LRPSRIRRTAAWILSAVAASSVRTDALSSTDEARMLRAVPPWILPMVITAESRGAISRLTIVWT
jgi:hypothetical protein